MKILFLGFRHRADDPRLFHREMKALIAKRKDLQIYFLGPFTQYDMAAFLSGERSVQTLAEDASEIYRRNHIQRGLSFQSIIRRVRRATSILRQVVRACGMKPDVVQASDARELLWALIIRIFTGARIIYDSHEDYFNQVYEYSGKSFRSFVKAYGIELAELSFIRFFEAVFCTDDYLYQKYAQPKYGAKQLYLLRNFPMMMDMVAVSSYSEKSTLSLVYIGGVNQHRGVRECAQYVAKFNQEHDPCKLTLTLYTPDNPIVEELVQQNLVRHVGWVEHTELLKQLTKYDVGICLWHPLEKFHRNLPLKNFDYMGVGLPIITSNFGNLEKYARLSGAAICIDPLSYTEFEQAALALFDPRRREELGKNGIKYTKSSASFEVEAEPYVRILTSTSHSSSEQPLQSLS